MYLRTVSQQVKTRDRGKTQGRKTKLSFAILHELPILELDSHAFVSVIFQNHLLK